MFIRDDGLSHTLPRWPPNWVRGMVNEKALLVENASDPEADSFLNTCH